MWFIIDKKLRYAYDLGTMHITLKFIFVLVEELMTDSIHPSLDNGVIDNHVSWNNS